MSLVGTNLDQYHLLQLIGSGGMGEVYLAEDTQLKRNIAIKVCKTEIAPYPNPALNQQAAHLFQREARAIAQLEHPHILPLYDFGEQQLNDTVLVYLVMQYCKEGSLLTWLHHRDNSALLSPQSVVHIVTQAAEALQYAHYREIIHQDVKPSNFLIRSPETPDPDYPNLLLADFGIAKVASATSNSNSSVRGTAIYMAPEQWTGSPVPATDQYALAIMAYELLTGQPPFQGRSEQVMYAHINISPQPPSATYPHLPRDIDDVLLMALAKSPEARFMTITAFARAFQQAARASKQPATINGPHDGDLHTSLAISRAEALSGANRVLTLPGGRQMPVAIPAGSFDGQSLRLEGLGSPSLAGPPGALVLTILVKESETIVQSPNFDQNTVIRSLPPTTGVADVPSFQPMYGNDNPTMAVTPPQPAPLAPSSSSWLPEAATWQSQPPQPQQTAQSQPWQASQPHSWPPEAAMWQSGQPRVNFDAPLPVPATVSAGQPTARQRRSSPLVAVLIALIIFLLVASVAGVYYLGFYLPQYNSSIAAATANANNATAQAATNATAQTATNATAQAATATAQVSPVASTSPSNLTPTPTTNPVTSQVFATQTANASNPNPYVQNSGPLLINDPLLDNSAGNRWNVASPSDPGACYFVNTSYHVVEHKAHWFMNCMEFNPHEQNLSNFVFQVNMTILAGDQGGIDFRQAANGKFYNFRIDANGNYELAAYFDNTNPTRQILQTGTASSFNNGYNQTNTLAIVAQSSSITIYINSTSQSVFNVNDSTYSSGSIGFIAQATNGDVTDVVFSNALLWSLQ